MIIKIKRRNKKTEESLQLGFARWMKLQHSGIIFRSDFAAGFKMTIAQAVKHRQMQESKSYPDIFIAAARKAYHGCYLELKKDRSEVYRKDGKMVADKRIEEQASMLLRLRAEGYYADFAFGIDDAIKQANYYLNPLK